MSLYLALSLSVSFSLFPLTPLLFFTLFLGHIYFNLPTVCAPRQSIKKLVDPDLGPHPLYAQIGKEMRWRKSDREEERKRELDKANFCLFLIVINCIFLHWHLSRAKPADLSATPSTIGLAPLPPFPPPLTCATALRSSPFRFNYGNVNLLSTSRVSRIPVNPTDPPPLPLSLGTVCVCTSATWRRPVLANFHV